jgi:hypothetical protein
MKKGEIQEIVDAARRAREEGNFNLSNELIVKAEQTVRPEDLDGIVELWSAIGMERMGDFDPEVRDRKSHEYLLLLGEAGNVRAQEILMMDFLQGLNGVARDIDKFLYWSQVAIENGSEVARSERRKFLRLNTRKMSGKH